TCRQMWQKVCTGKLTNPWPVLLDHYIAIIVAFNGWRARRGIVKENRNLKDHLHTEMGINAIGNEEQRKKLEELSKKNENLRISLAALKNRADKSELRTLYLYDKAIHMMYEKSPGFAPAWESVLKEAEGELAKTETGLLAWTRKIIRPALGVERAAVQPPAVEDSRSSRISVTDDNHQARR
ncbi:hypothetical protein, partial [Spongiibacter tropicus]|uniref:hypothetical protein n=1 Tax=Spongiibacter tropicus TaxID=454602 RepID=UPI003008A794